MEMFYYLFFFFGVFCLFSCFEFIVFSDDWHLIIFCISFRRAAYWLNVYIISKVTPPTPIHLAPAWHCFGRQPRRGALARRRSWGRASIPRVTQCRSFAAGHRWGKPGTQTQFLAAVSYYSTWIDDDPEIQILMKKKKQDGLNQQRGENYLVMKVSVPHGHRAIHLLPFLCWWFMP